VSFVCASASCESRLVCGTGIRSRIDVIAGGARLVRGHTPPFGRNAALIVHSKCHERHGCRLRASQDSPEWRRQWAEQMEPIAVE